MKIILFLLLSVISGPKDYVVVENIEYNHVYDENTKELRFSQIIIKKWMVLPDSIGYRVSSFNVIKECLILRKNGGREISYQSSDGKEHRYFTKSFREYSSYYDAEHEDRKFLPQELR